MRAPSTFAKAAGAGPPLGERVTAAATMLAKAARPLRVLSAIDWAPAVRERFMAAGGREMPRVSYAPFDAAPVLQRVARARRAVVGHAGIDAWIGRHCDAIENTARMLAAVGTPAFHLYSQQIYGDATTPPRFHATTPLDLARNVHATIDAFARARPEFVPPPTQGSAAVAGALRTAVDRHFGEDAPTVRVVAHLSGDALATSREIRIRRGARFTERDAQKLLQHEAYVHVATSINGRCQYGLPIVGVNYPYNARTQEGLAVFAEVVTGTLEIDRLRTLANRVIAIDMASEGADFLQVYRWFLERCEHPEQAFENTRRVFRGGVLAGGAPFTKDVTYLYGLLQVANLVRIAFATGRADVLRTLFCGKLDVQDVPVLCELANLKLLRAPRYLPPWVSDPRGLLATLAFSTFMHRVEQAPMMRAAQALLAETPIVRF